MRGRFEHVIREGQNSICAAVERLDGGTFHEDAWIRPGGGGGISRVLQVSRPPLPTLPPPSIKFTNAPDSWLKYVQLAGLLDNALAVT